MLQYLLVLENEGILSLELIVLLRIMMEVFERRDLFIDNVSDSMR